MQNYKLSFEGFSEGIDEQQSFVIFVKANSKQGAIDKVTDIYQATNIQVL